MVTPRTLPDALAARLRDRPGDPFVTFYDLATGERVELSATTWANWTAKVAGLLTDDLDLVAGDRLLVDVGTHWQATVLLGGAWQAGVEVLVPGAPGEADAVCCAQTRAEAYAGGRAPVVALSLAPLSGPCGPLPDGVLDFFREVPSQPDAYLGVEHPTPDAAAWSDGDGTLTHAQLLEERLGERVLSVEDPAAAPGVRLLASLLGGGGSLVLVRTHGQPVPDHVAEQERVSVR